MKRLAPTILVKVSYEVVIVIDKRAVMLFPALKPGIMDLVVVIDDSPYSTGRRWPLILILKFLLGLSLGNGLSLSL